MDTDPRTLRRLRLVLVLPVRRLPGPRSRDRGYVFVAHLIAYGDLGWVDAGTTVGYVGDTGLSTAPHAHVEWHPWDGGAVDPTLPAAQLRLSAEIDLSDRSARSAGSR